jgi:type I restriction enzyme M protein
LFSPFFFRLFRRNNYYVISDKYHAWRNEPIEGQKIEYKDVAGFCKAVKLVEIREQRHILTPGRYVGAEEEEDDGEVFEEK